MLSGKDVHQYSQDEKNAADVTKFLNGFKLNPAKHPGLTKIKVQLIEDVGANVRHDYTSHTENLMNKNADTFSFFEFSRGIAKQGAKYTDELNPAADYYLLITPMRLHFNIPLNYNTLVYERKSHDKNNALVNIEKRPYTWRLTELSQTAPQAIVDHLHSICDPSDPDYEKLKLIFPVAKDAKDAKNDAPNIRVDDFLKKLNEARNINTLTNQLINELTEYLQNKPQHYTISPARKKAAMQIIDAANNARLNATDQDYGKFLVVLRKIRNDVSKDHSSYYNFFMSSNLVDTCDKFLTSAFGKQRLDEALKESAQAALHIHGSAALPKL